jgi:flagellar hook protein FlgE
VDEPINVSFEVNGRQQSLKYIPNVPKPYPIITSTQGASAPTNPTVFTTPGTGSSTETAALTFTDLSVGQSVTIAGRTLTASAALTGAQVATAFSGTPVTDATMSDTLMGWTVGASSGANLTFTSSTANSNVTDIAVSTAGRVEIATVQFQAIKSGQSITVAGKTLTATSDLTANLVASAISGASVSGATVTGLFNGWTAGSLSSANLTFTSTASATNVTDLTTLSAARGSKEDFFRQLDQQTPVNFAPTKKTEATASQPEKQTIDVYGRVMKGDKFELTLTLPGKTPLEQTLTVNLTTPTPSLTETSSLDDRIAALGNAITAAILAAGSSSSVTVEASDNKIVLTYPTAGTTTVPASIKQTRRGSDADGYSTIDLSDQSVLTAKTVRIDGTVSTATQYDITLRDPDNNPPAFHVGDVFRITVPDENGSETSYDVQVPAYGGKTAGQTFSSMTDFVEAMKTATNLPAELNLSYLTGATDTFTAKIGTSGNIAGTLTFEKIKDCRLSSGAAVTTTIRPNPVGLFYFDHQGNNLEVVGDRNGESFRMNVRIDGEVKTALPVGAANNPNGANGVQIGQAKTISLNKGSNDLLGVGLGANVNYVSGTGLPSSAATAIGTTAITSMSQTFFLNESLGENRMTFTVDGIVGTITLPIRAYTGDTFATAIQDRVNQIQDPKTGRIVSGVSVKFDPDNNRLIFTSGTTGQNSQINVVGHPNFGLGKVTQTAGSVPVITNLKQATDDQGNKLYVTADGEVTTADPGSQQNWYPLYLTEGQLTFDTVGKLISPKEGVIYSPFDPQNGSDLLRLNIDYGKYSTQFSSPFSVLSLSQDGYPSGSLNGLDIDAGGTIRANYTNGQTVALGKVMIANFANPNGLKQIGNANYVATSTSGQVVLGQAGADGFGNIKAGALERSNVDITEELVNLITAQRNFQANAKAIETTTQLSQTIIQIRG